MCETSWITGRDGRNLRFRRETLLNYAMNRRVFFIYSVKSAGKKKKIHNTEVISEILDEIRRLREIQPR